MQKATSKITDRRAKILDCFFDIESQNNAREVKREDLLWLAPKDIKAKLSIEDKLDYRTFIRDLKFFFFKYTILTDHWTDKEKYDACSDKNKYNTKYKLTDDKKIQFHIPADHRKRLLYARAITALLIATDELIDGGTVLPIVNSSSYQLKNMIMYLFDGLVRDTFLAVALFDYFHYGEGSLFSILVELSQFNQHINIKIELNKSKMEFNNVRVESITINENMKINLNFGLSSVLLNSLSDIRNISILTEHYPKEIDRNHIIFRIKKKQLYDEIHKHKNFPKMNEWLSVKKESFEVTQDFNAYLNDIFKSEINERKFLDRAHLLSID